MQMPPAAGSTPAFPARPARRSNWGLRLVALALSALAFLGFWQGAQRSGAGAANATTGGTYAPPTGAQGGLLPPGGFGAHGSTRLS